MAVVVVMLGAVAFVFLVGVVAALISDQKEWERKQSEQIREQQSRSDQLAQMGPMELYLSTGAVPDGRTAEILMLAQESHDKREGRR